ncbi:histidine phosphatase superfamily [Phlyctochytrium arcticum]|nr:histidine phosphatase superfamily [Phlyctochytrium arcticum]
MLVSSITTALATLLAASTLDTVFAAPQLVSTLLLSRHGARTPLFKDTKTFSEGNSQLTIEGQAQLFESGTWMRERLSTVWGKDGVVEDKVLARSSDTDRTLGSAMRLLAGMVPPEVVEPLRLRNGTVIPAPTVPASPLSTNMIPIHSVAQNDDILLRGWFNCTRLDKSVDAMFETNHVNNIGAAYAPLLDRIGKQYFGRSVGLRDMWNVFDFLNVQRSYNASFTDTLTEKEWQDVTQLVAYMETEKFRTGLGAKTFLREVLNWTKQRINEGESARGKVNYYSGHYTTFMNFFGLTALFPPMDQVTPFDYAADKAGVRYPYILGLPDYGSLLVFDLMQDTDTKEYSLRTSFRNGQNTEVVIKYPGVEDLVPVTQFYTRMEPLATTDTSLKSWCDACGNKVSRGCELVAGSTQSKTSDDGPGGIRNPKMAVGVATLGGFLAGLAVWGIAAYIVPRVKRRNGKATWKKASGKSQDGLEEMRV